MKFMLINKGAISIFLLIILLPVMVLSSILIDGSRKLAADMIAQEAADSAAMSVLADYNGLLKMEFGLFAINDSTKVNENFKKYLSSTLMASGIEDPVYTEIAYDYLKGMLFGGSKFKDANFLDFYDFKIKSTKVDPMYSLANPEVLENQIVEYMKYRAPLEMIKKSDFLKISEGMKQFKEVKDSSELLSKKNEYDKQLCKLQALSKDVESLVNQVNAQFNADYFKQVETGYLSRIKSQSSAAEAQKALDDYKEEIDKNIQKKGIDICQKSWQKNIIDKAEDVLKKIDDVKGQASALINEMNGKKSEPGMTGEVAAQIIAECENTLKELNKNRINQLITDTETKKAYLEKYKKSFAEYFDHSDFTKEQDFNTIKVAYTKIVTKRNPKAGWQIIFQNPFSFGAAPGVNQANATNYRTTAKPKAGKGIVNQSTSPVNIENGYPQYSNLPTQLKKLSEPDMIALSSIDKAYVGGLLNDLAKSKDEGSIASQDMSEVLNSIDFVEEKQTWWQKLFKTFSDDSNKTALDVVMGGVSWIFEGGNRFSEDLRDDILEAEYAAGVFKSRLTVNKLPIPSAAEMDKEHIVKWRYETDQYGGFEGEHDLRGLPKQTRKTMFQNAEMEYLVAGNPSEEWCKNQVYSSIFSLRLTNNLIAVYKDPARNKACLGAAAAVSAAVGGIGTPVLHWSFMLALASTETILDMNFLVEKGYRVPLIKRSENLNLSFDINNPSKALPAPNFTKGDISVCYEDYLKILMIMLVDRKTRVKRIGDLIQMDMYKMGKTDFEMQKAYTFVRAESDATINYLFLPVVAKNHFNKPLGTMGNRNIIYQGY